MTTYTIKWVDPVADAVSVVFSDNPNSPVSVPVDKQDPDSWSAAITDYWNTNNSAIPRPLDGIINVPVEIDLQAS